MSTSHARNNSAKHSPRRGLAPLEFVLWLPVLLGVMAMMVNLGTMTAWRVRGEIVSRDITWKQRYPRLRAVMVDEAGNAVGQFQIIQEPRPAEKIWPTPAAIEVVGEPQIAELNDPAIDHPVAHGPLPNGFIVNPVLQPDSGARSGESSIQRRFPLLSKLGDYQSGPIRNPHLDERWQGVEMGVPRNWFRRIKILYELPKTNPALPQAYISSVESLLAIPHYSDLSVLDRDEEVKKYTGYYIDFHPRIIPNICETDPEEVKRTKVRPLIGDIGALAAMASTVCPATLPAASLPWLASLKQEAAFLFSTEEEPTYFVAMLDDSDDDDGDDEDGDRDDDDEEGDDDDESGKRKGKVRRLPANMTLRFLGMYNAAIERLKQQIKQMQEQQSSLPGKIASLSGKEKAAAQAYLNSLSGKIQSAQAEIASLQPKIEQLESFLKRLKEKGYGPGEDDDDDDDGEENEDDDDHEDDDDDERDDD